MERITTLPPIPERGDDCHKGDFGRVLVVAGSTGMTGAAALTAGAAMRTGSGLVTVACPRSLNPVLEVKLTEAMTLPVDETAGGALALEAFDGIAEFAARCDCVALGPGVGRSTETQELVRRLAARIEAPVVVDADGLAALAALAGAESGLSGRGAPAVITPHPGEASELLGTVIAEIQADREAAAVRLAEITGAVAVLKGAGTVVTDGSRIYVNDTGNPGMASGGTGDVLTGVIASLIGQGMPPFEASALGVHLHGLAGDMAAGALGEAGMIASDMVDLLPMAMMEYDDSQPGGGGAN